MTRRQGHPGDEDHREDRRARDYTEFGFRELGKADPLDRYLDGEIDRESGAFRAAFVKREFRERLDEMEEILSDLGRPVKGPDLADSILSAVDERRPFMEKRTRRFVTLGRLAAAASVLPNTDAKVLTGAISTIPYRNRLTSCPIRNCSPTTQCPPSPSSNRIAPAPTTCTTGLITPSRRASRRSTSKIASARARYCWPPARAKGKRPCCS